MRYYQIVITNPKTGQEVFFKSLGMRCSSLLPSGPQLPQSGLSNPAALCVEMDFPMANATYPAGDCWLRIWGLSIADLETASDLNGFSIAVYGGMSRGLPLANPNQAGMLVNGIIRQCYGNWEGTSQTVDLNIVAGGSGVGSSRRPGNFPFVMPAGMQLAKALANTLTIALPNLSQSINISPNLVLNYDVTGWYPTLATLASALNDISHGALGGDYEGITIAINAQTVSVYDGTVMPSNVKSVNFQDLIGQPTWLAPGLMVFKTVMRADIHQGDVVSLPPTLFGQSRNSFQAGTPSKGRLTFSGNFRVGSIHHWGVSRQPDAASWCSVFLDCVPVAST